MRAVFILCYYVPRAGGQDWAGIPQARLDSNGISKVGNRTDSAWRSGGSVRMVNKAFRRPAEFSGGFYSRRAGSWWREGDAVREG